ncbi:MAG: transposase [bacterium]
MPYRKEQLESGEIYHITIRRVGDALLFKDIDDYYRGIFSIYEFNTSAYVTIRERRRIRTQIKKSIQDNSTPSVVIDSRDKLVEVLAFCLMPNHIHLLVKQLKDGGISKFMQKFGVGYSSYFREKHQLKRREHFFDGVFSAVHIENDEQLKTVFVYIHTNPIALIEPGWKEKGIVNTQEAINFIEGYKWSSYQDYIGKKNFFYVTERKFLSEVMGGEKGCKDFVDNWIEYKNEMSKF